MPIKYVPFFPDTVQGQAILRNFTRTRKLKYNNSDQTLQESLERGMPYYEVEKIEEVRNSPPVKGGDTEGVKNMLIRGECISACAYLREKGIKVDLVYIDPPFASGADYAKKIYIRRNPKVADAIKKAEEEMEMEDLKAFEEKMYGDIWNKEEYLNWMYENLLAIRSVMTNSASIYAHLDWHIGHYVKILMDEIFGEDSFKNEIIWHYEDKFATGGRSFDKNHDLILLYAINQDDYVFNPIIIPKEQASKRALRKKINGKTVDVLDADGKKIIVEYTEKKADDVWDLPRTISKSDYLDYGTQKADSILRRIIDASSNELRVENGQEKMVVADFFGGSGVASEVANDLKRNFIHVDVGVNSIQTARDRLVAANAEFDILEIKDGVALFRNPQQTMDKLATLIKGLQRKSNGLSSFWFGSINNSKLGTTPVYIPNLLDHTQKVFDKVTANQLVNQELPELDKVKQVIVYYIDIDDKDGIEKFIKEQNNTTIEVELRDLKEVLDDVVVDDIVDYKIKETKKEYEITIKKFISDRLRQKIDEFNQKGKLQSSQIEMEEENGNETAEEKKKKKFAPIEISKEGLELIELIGLDCTNKNGIWKSDKEIKINKYGYVIENGEKTKTFWNAKIKSEKKPLRMKVRNIAGDEIVIKIVEDSTRRVEGK